MKRLLCFLAALVVWSKAPAAGQTASDLADVPTGDRWIAHLTGGAGSPRPGEVSLAHNGILFLDEFPEFPRDVLEMLRQPIEDGTVTVARSIRSACFPANFILVSAMNPCPCRH